MVSSDQKAADKIHHVQRLKEKVTSSLKVLVALDLLGFGGIIWALVAPDFHQVHIRALWGDGVVLQVGLESISAVRSAWVSELREPYHIQLDFGEAIFDAIFEEFRSTTATIVDTKFCSDLANRPSYPTFSGRKEKEVFARPEIQIDCKKLKRLKFASLLFRILYTLAAFAHILGAYSLLIFLFVYPSKFQVRQALCLLHDLPVLLVTSAVLCYTLGGLDGQIVTDIPFRFLDAKTIDFGVGVMLIALLNVIVAAVAASLCRRAVHSIRPHLYPTRIKKDL